MLVIKPGTSELRIWCRKCSKVIEPGEELVTFLYDGNPVGTGPSEHRECYEQGMEGRFRND